MPNRPSPSLRGREAAVAIHLSTNDKLLQTAGSPKTPIGITYPQATPDRDCARILNPIPKPLKLTVISLILSLVFLGRADFAIASGTPEQLLQTILKSDFNGSPDARLDHVIYSGSGRASTLDCPSNQLNCGSSRPEVYYLDNNDVQYIVSDSIREEPKPNASKSCKEFSVFFNVIAMTSKNVEPRWRLVGRQEIMSLKRPKTIEINYELRKFADGWKVYNPPQPAVGLNAMKTYFSQKIIEFSAINFNTTKNETDRKLLEQRRTLFVSWYSHELTILNSIK